METSVAAAVALAPWLSPLLGLLDVETRYMDRSSGINVDIPPRTTTMAAQLSKLRDALALLSALGYADREAWVRALCHCCKRRLPEHYTSGVGPDALPMERFLFVLHGEEEEDSDHGSAWDASCLRQLLSAPPSDAFDAGLEVIAAYYPEVRTQQLDVFITIAIRARTFTPSTWVEHTVSTLLALHDKNRGWRLPVSSDADQCALVVDVVALNMNNPLMRGTIQAVRDLAARGDGLKLSPIELLLYPDVGAREDFQWVDAQTFAEFVRQLLLRPQETGGRATLSEISFFSGMGVPATLSRLCSALAEAQTLDTVQLGLSSVLDVDSWAWARVAYAFFSTCARAHSAVTSLVLFDAILTVSHAEAIANVLAAAHPAIHVFRPRGPQFTEATAPRRVTLYQGTAVELQPMHHTENIPSDQARVVLPTNVSGVSILGTGEDQDTVMALLPGYGLCAVHQGKCAQVDEVGEDASARAGAGITSLTLTFANFDDAENLASSMEGFPRFLQLVGADLTRLVLQVPEEATLDIAVVFESCPNLLELEIYGIDLDAAAFLQAYDASGLRIRKLCCQFSDSAPVINELQNKDAALTRSLKAFEYLAEVERRDGQPSELAAILEMLRVNRSLEHVRIRVSYDAFDRYVGVVREYDHESLPVARKPFPLANRIAFLSIFNPRQPPTGQVMKRAKMTTPEASVPDALRPPRLAMEIIFAFAAERLCRRVEMPRTF